MRYTSMSIRIKGTSKNYHSTAPLTLTHFPLSLETFDLKGTQGFLPMKAFGEMARGEGEKLIFRGALKRF
jgi:hypothetical protein